MRSASSAGAQRGLDRPWAGVRLASLVIALAACGRMGYGECPEAELTFDAPIYQELIVPRGCAGVTVTLWGGGGGAGGAAGTEVAGGDGGGGAFGELSWGVQERASLTVVIGGGGRRGADHNHAGGGGGGGASMLLDGDEVLLVVAGGGGGGGAKGTDTECSVRAGEVGGGARISGDGVPSHGTHGDCGKQDCSAGIGGGGGFGSAASGGDGGDNAGGGGGGGGAPGGTGGDARGETGCTPASGGSGGQSFVVVGGYVLPGSGRDPGNPQQSQGAGRGGAVTDDPEGADGRGVLRWSP